jgi:[ribosomal protein S18]-alanine N-acetyltransferase
MDDPTAITIRQMKAEDIEEVVQIDQLSFSLPWPRSSFRFEVTENKASRHWVAEIIQEGQTRVIGMLICWFIIDEAHIGTIAVHPDFRRHKIAETLMKHALEVLKSEGTLKVLLEVRRSNEAALALYHKLGFVEDGVRKRYYSDNHEDAILMQLPDLSSFQYQEHDDELI